MIKRNLTIIWSNWPKPFTVFYGHSVEWPTVLYDRFSWPPSKEWKFSKLMSYISLFKFCIVQTSAILLPNFRSGLVSSGRKWKVLLYFYASKYDLICSIRSWKRSIMKGFPHIPTNRFLWLFQYIFRNCSSIFSMFWILNIIEWKITD